MCIWEKWFSKMKSWTLKLLCIIVFKTIKTRMTSWLSQGGEPSADNGVFDTWMVDGYPDNSGRLNFFTLLI